MNFELSDETQQVRAEARAVLSEHAASSARGVLEQEQGFDRALWDRVRALGWLGAAIPEEFGGSALGEEGLCAIAEELGRSLAAIPFASNAYLVSQALLLFGSAEQKSRFLPLLASGDSIGAFALAEQPGAPSAASISTRFEKGALHGTKRPAVDGGIADLAVVVAKHEGGIGLALASLANVSRTRLQTIDPSRDVAGLAFQNAPAELLPGAQGWSSVETLLDRAAILFAFEQIGGAQAALEMARDYALERTAFGRPIGSFQAIKHKLADVYIATELARSNAYYGAWALSANAPDITTAAAAARVAATKAFGLASQENIQTHGGMGFTWEFDCHLYYRRAKHLALAIGAAGYWKNRLVSSIERRNAA